MEGKNLELAELLNKVKEEIRKSEDEISPKRGDITGTEYESPNLAEARNLYFRTTEVEVEATVVIKKEGEGKVKFYVFGAGGKYSKEETHRIKIKMISQGHIFPELVQK